MATPESVQRTATRMRIAGEALRIALEARQAIRDVEFWNSLPQAAGDQIDPAPFAAAERYAVGVLQRLGYNAEGLDNGG